MAPGCKSFDALVSLSACDSKVRKSSFRERSSLISANRLSCERPKPTLEANPWPPLSVFPQEFCFLLGVDQGWMSYSRVVLGHSTWGGGE